YKSQNGLPELLITAVGEKSAGSEVEPIEVNVSDIDLTMLNQYLTFGPVSIAAATANNNFTATDADGNTITVYNQFNNASYGDVVEVSEGEGFFVTGFVSVYSGKVQFVPVSIDGGKVIETVATPVISPASGSLEAGTLITIECATEGAQIYYTTEDATPSATSVTSLLYDGAISFSENMTIKAIAVKEGMYDSNVAEATFTLAVAGETEATFDFTVDNGVGESTKADLAQGGDTKNGGTNSLNEVTLTQGVVSMTCSIGEGGTDPKWWTDPGLRIYKNNTVTFTVPEGCTLISIVANQGTATAANFNKAKFTASTGSMDSTGHTWTPAEGDEVTEVTLTQQSGDNGRLGGFTVKYTNGLGAIEEIGVDANAPVEFYNLQGVRVSSDVVAPGIYVVRQGSKAMKVLVK
ncbi:MAG: chitobiase/beta-hexosaminidase C-terminal domain-containing protein, partial [Paramuribaculum sp.]|nr:chitobiase/beta-hexosaminidase C-terminal domain-containing protein [Paramuribaculum sp.]